MLAAPNVHVPFMLNHIYAVSIWFVSAQELSSQPSGCIREVVLTSVLPLTCMHMLFANERREGNCHSLRQNFGQ